MLSMSALPCWPQLRIEVTDKPLPAQTVDATLACSLLAGVWKPKVFLGRRFKRSATWSSCACEMGARSVPRGKYCLNRRLVFSLVPRCHGLCGSQKYTFTFVSTVKLLCLAISCPRSQVNERRRVAGSLSTCLLSAATTVSVSLLGTLTSMVKRECRSTRVAI